MFKILKKDKSTKARLGVLSTPHGKIKTPSYVIVATHAEIKCLKPSDIKKTKTQVVIANTYHLWGEITKHPSTRAKHGTGRSKTQNTNKSQIQNHKTQTFLLNKLRIKLPTMTDSGGFQVFSLGFSTENKIGKILKLKPVDNRLRKSIIHRRKNIRITEKGVYFLLDGKKRFLGPEISMQIQEKLGADIIFTFDECTSPLDGFDYNKKALERTHAWALKCLRTHNRPQYQRARQSPPHQTNPPLTGQSPPLARRSPLTAIQKGGRFGTGQATNNPQMLFGIVQGGKYKSLRIKSAKFISSLLFDGFGIGGSFGKNEMIETLKWVVPYLPEEKPRHLLGIGKVEDIFSAVEQGIDLFDCVIPTREARHGRIYTKTGYYDTSKNQSKNIQLEKGCKCPVCQSGIIRKKLHELFKGGDREKQKAQRWATIHNVWFFNNLMGEIRKSIKNNKFKQFKNRFLSQF